jgi:GNAT superfamily N-acetyltransferase
MPEFAVVEARPESAWAVDAYHDLDLAHSLDVFGEDLTMSVDRTRVFLAEEDAGLHVLLLAVAGPSPATPTGRFGLPLAPDLPAGVLGAALFSLPTADNQHLLDDLFIIVAASSRRQGVGTALLEEVRRIGKRHGRDTVLTWSEHLIAPAAPALPQLAAPTGSGSVPVDGTVGFLQAMGFELAQVERQSRLDLPTPSGLLGGLRADAEAVAGSRYRVDSWRGQVPEQHLEGVAELYRAMSTDAPVGEIDFRTENWDAERLLAHDRRLLLTGDLLQTIALSRANGDVAAITVLYVPQTSPHRPEQFTTVVLDAHRGHRLGAWIKAANLAALEAAFPQARYVDTWNADENSHMLAINTALGYRPHGVTGAWQARLSRG